MENLLLTRDFTIVGYETSWDGDAVDIRFDKITHINYAFLLPSDEGDGSLRPVENTEKLRRLVTSAHDHGIKALISVGGWNDGNDEGFERLSESDSTARTFVNNLAGFVAEYDLDGADIDWEYPDAGDSARNFSRLMQLLSSDLRGRGKLLTAAVSALDHTCGITGEVFNYVDFLTLMAYDSDEGAGHSPFEYAERSLNYWLGRGLPRAKAVLGVPFYERPNWNPYRNLVASDPQAANVDSIVYEGTPVYYNGIPTIRRKTELALQRGGGMMIWHLSQDTDDDTSLLTAIYETARIRRA
jgi:chitinase